LITGIDTDHLVEAQQVHSVPDRVGSPARTRRLARSRRRAPTNVN
jgi:hypothetical protein